MRVILLSCLVGVGTIIAAACTSNSQVILPPPGSVAVANVYWTLDNFTTPRPELEVGPYPLTNASVPSVTLGSAASGLFAAASLQFDSSGRLFVGRCQSGTRTIWVFTLPITASSAPAFVLTLSSAGEICGFTFDAQGNLWVSSFNTNTVLEFTGPFNSTATISPALTLNVTNPGQPAFDANGNLYVPSFVMVGIIDVFDRPITNLMSPSATLHGVVNPFGLAFDGSGNLYAGLGDSVTGSGIARFNSSNLANGATPNTTDSTGQFGSPFSFQLAVDGAGNLYNADCGSAARLYVYPTVSSSFSSTLAPTVTYTDASIAASGCVGGVAVR